jgi:hypothetical protein
MELQSLESPSIQIHTIPSMSTKHQTSPFEAKYNGRMYSIDIPPNPRSGNTDSEDGFNSRCVQNEHSKTEARQALGQTVEE